MWFQWVFLQENPSWDSSSKNLMTDSAEYFKNMHTGNLNEAVSMGQ